MEEYSTKNKNCLSNALQCRIRRVKSLTDKGNLKCISYDEVKEHNNKDSGWIVVDGYVYDITAHVINHKGWTCGCSVSTLYAILRTLGTDCTDEVLETHSEQALEFMQSFMIGVQQI